MTGDIRETIKSIETNSTSTRKSELRKVENMTCVPESTRVEIVRVDISNLNEDSAVFADKVSIREDSVTAPFTVKWSPVGNANEFYHRHFNSPLKSEDNKGVNEKGARKAEICLAKYAEQVANDFQTVGNCYTGGKYSLLACGVIDDYGDMPKGSAKDAIPYFDANPEKFRKIDVNKEDLDELSCGKIIVFTEDGKPGHFVITNGNSQGMSDFTDNLKWLDLHPNGQFQVYELTDNWQYNRETQKVEFVQPQA